MKKFALLVLLSFLIQHNVCSAATSVYTENNKFGLVDSNGIVVEAKYKKLVRLGEQSWIMQDGSKFGIIHDNGKVLIEPEYNQAERVLGKYVKFRKGSRYGIYDELGFELLPVEYSSIDLLYGGMFIISKNYKYGLADMNGSIVLDTLFDDIYMPDFETLILVYNNKQMEFKRSGNSESTIPFNIFSFNVTSSDVKITDIASNPIASTGYYGVTLTDYIFKLFSSISPAYEQTIDELMFSQGADTVSVLVKCSWIPKFPFVYAKNYYQNIADPYNGPLSSTKKLLRRKIKE